MKILVTSVPHMTICNYSVVVSLLFSLIYMSDRILCHEIKVAYIFCQKVDASLLIYLTLCKFIKYESKSL